MDKRLVVGLGFGVGLFLAMVGYVEYRDHLPLIRTDVVPLPAPAPVARPANPAGAPPEAAHNADELAAVPPEVTRPLSVPYPPLPPPRIHESGPVPSPQPRKPYIVGESDQDANGGDIDPFIKRTEQLRATKQPVHIVGLCFSACTIITGLPPEQLCVTPNAVIGVHQMTMKQNGRRVALSEPQQLKAMRDYYPLGLQNWITAHGGLTKEPKYIFGDELRKIFNACP